MPAASSSRVYGLSAQPRCATCPSRTSAAQPLDPGSSDRATSGIRSRSPPCICSEHEDAIRRAPGRASRVHCPIENNASRSWLRIDLERDHRLRPADAVELRQLAGHHLRQLLVLAQSQHRDEVPLAGDRVRPRRRPRCRPARRRESPAPSARPGSERSRVSCRSASGPDRGSPRSSWSRTRPRP